MVGWTSRRNETPLSPMSHDHNRHQCRNG
jgi:hypothetical protein